MAKILVSIISEHLIPNYHLFLHFTNDIDEHVLITTSKMESYATNFVELLNPEKKVSKLILDDFSNFETVNKNLINSNLAIENEYIVNITGGTKIISLAVFNYFRERKSLIYYVAIGTNSCQQIYPNQKLPEEFNHQLSLIDYLSLYGFSIEKSNKLFKNPSDTKQLFAKVETQKYNALSVYEIRDAFTKNEQKANSQQLLYLKGLWFEEYMYNLIKEKLHLKDTQMALNVKVKRNKDQTNVDNEFDLMFVKNNKLYVVECKSSIGEKKDHKKNIESYLYKLAAAVKDLGLQVIPILAIIGEVEKHEGIVNRAEILRIQTIGSEKFKNKILFDTFIKLL